MSGLKALSLVIVLLASLAMLLNSCATVGQKPVEKEKPTINLVGKAIVLFRIIPDSDSGKFFGPKALALKISSPDTGQYSESISPTILTPSEAQGKGWVYLTLEPGTYYIDAAPKERNNSKCCFYVPHDNHIIYIGSFYSSYVSWGASKYRNVSVNDETEAAEAVALNSFSQCGPLVSCIMKPLFMPFTQKTITELTPMGFMTTNAKSLVSPDWKKRAISRATGIGDGCTSGANSYFNFKEDHPYLSEFLEGGNEGAAPLLVLLYIYYLPAAITGGAIAGEVAEHKWQPTIQGLQQGLQESDPAILLDSAFETMLSQYGGSKAINLNQADDPFAQAKQQGLKSIFQTEILKIEMNECGTRGLFGFAITLRTRLWETASKTLLYDLVSQYSNTALRRKKSLFYEFYETEMKGKGTECRKMEAYGGAEGGKLLNEVISKAIQASMQGFFNDVVKEKSQ